MRTHYSIPIIANAFLASTVGLLILSLATMGLVGERASFIALTLLLLIYLCMEVGRLRRVHSYRWMINPVFLCSILTFFLSYSLTNFIYFLPLESVAPLGIIPEVTDAMAKHMYLVLLAAITMWLGYWSPLASRLTRPGVVARFQRRVLPSSYSVRFFVVLLLFSLSVGARLALIKLGIFGYSSHPGRLVQAGNYSQYIGYVAGFGKLALLLVALQYFSQSRKSYYGSWLITMLLIEMAFGFLSGMKSQVAMPLVIVGLCKYMGTGMFPRKWLFYSFLGLFVAYSVIEPFRAARNAEGRKVDTSVVSVAASIIGAAADDAPTVRESPSFLLQISSRSNLSYMGSLGVEFADNHTELPAGSPAFLENVLLAPLHAWIPRFIWESKPLGDLGRWYNRAVLGNNYSITSIAMGPVAYMYFAGGSFGIFVVFFVIGVIQRVTFFFFAATASIAGAMVFFPLLSILSNLDSAVNGMVVNLFRFVPVLLLMLPFVFERRARSVGIVGTAIHPEMNSHEVD